MIDLNTKLKVILYQLLIFMIHKKILKNYQYKCLDQIDLILFKIESVPKLGLVIMNFNQLFINQKKEVSF